MLLVNKYKNYTIISESILKVTVIESSTLLEEKVLLRIPFQCKNLKNQANDHKEQ